MTDEEEKRHNLATLAVLAALAVIDNAIGDNRSRTPLGDALADNLHNLIEDALNQYTVLKRSAYQYKSDIPRRTPEIGQCGNY